MNEERKKKLELLRAEKAIRTADEAKGVITEYLKGDPGNDGKDAQPPSDLELKEIIAPLIPDPIPGNKGNDGKDGKTPTKSELKTIIQPLIPKAIPGDPGKDGKVYRYVGSWGSGRSYKDGDVVEHEGSSFVALKDHTARNINEPDKGSEWLQFWGVVARKGAKGNDGHSSGGGGGGSSSGVQSVSAGTNVTITGTAQNPIINATGGGSSAWGGITGTLSDQTDLQTALNAKQPLDSDLTTIAGLTATTDNIIQSKAGAWASRTVAQFKSDLALTKSDVGLANVDNTSDANKPVSTAQQTALDLKFDKLNGTLTGVASPTYAAGKLVYDTDNESLSFFNNDSNVSLQVGQEEWIRVKNVSGSTIANGASVYINGANSGYPTIALAQANAGATAVSVGLATESIANNATGFVTCIGLVRGLDTSAFSAGAIVYVSSSVAGGLTSTAPTSPNYRYRVGIVGTSNAVTGTIHVTPSTASLGNGTVNQLLTISSTGTQLFRDLVRVNTVASSATPAINTDTTDHFTITALAANITSMTSSLTGTPLDGQRLLIRFKDNGTPRTITWGASFVSSGSATLLATTATSKTHLVALMYDSAAAKWVCVSSDATGY